ncbi:c-type cytochrome biogenesis protein CcsB [Syntrophobacter fumaroxidans]|uniref:Heme exporter protein C n=1 Tax=Syntrophobacter fumaroxidans (strain DSM 10017 / MPOB) TaxID=335543 RepID=A0LG42_SYNFM|nr:c-type cytochrome biogenesis protein CcsB [Syntrophobacter fumaroxidans]ABK16394.1 cytochrome c assembly protein [Syntrophobacter fumaroxidans MPOB]
MIDSSLLLSITTFAYLLCTVLYLSGVVFRAKRLLAAGTFCAAATIVVQTIGIILRWVESYSLGYGHAPLSNLYESLVFAAWAIMVIYLVFELRSGQRALGVFPALFAFLAMAYASFSTNIDSRIQPLIPALKSNWLIAHVVTCFLGYAAFAVSFGISILYLVARGRSGNPGTAASVSLLPTSKQLDTFNYQMVLFGFLWLSVGIITGSIWANSAWGTYWSWDPKETWSLITWLIYAALLHSRAMQGWRGKRVAWLSIFGFGCVLFTYFGVNFLLSGLHSYATK